MNEQWDDLPEGAKVVGRRVVPMRANAADAYALQDLVNESGGRGKVSWPRGVFRFRTYEEADEWWIKTMIVRK